MGRRQEEAGEGMGARLGRFARWVFRCERSIDKVMRINRRYARNRKRMSEKEATRRMMEEVEAMPPALPDVLSGLLRIAVNSREWIIDRRHTVEMDRHGVSLKIDGKLAWRDKTVYMPGGKDLMANARLMEKVAALDALRRGEVVNAVVITGAWRSNRRVNAKVLEEVEQRVRKVTHEKEGGTHDWDALWWEQMRVTVGELEAIGM